MEDSQTCQVWSFNIKILFEAYELTDVVDGTSKLNEELSEKEIKSWKMKDTKAQKLIITTVENNVRLHMRCPTAKEMYET